jgi:hypothetical protein
MGNPADPALKPVVPPAGSPDDPARPLRAPSAEPVATAASWAAPAPDIRPAVPEAWSTTVPLEHALLVDGQNLAVIAIRRPTGADVAELMEQDPDEATLPVRLRARICGVHPAVFAALWADDSERVAEAIGPFLPTAVLDIEAALALAPAAASD